MAEQKKDTGMVDADLMKNSKGSMKRPPRGVRMHVENGGEIFKRLMGYVFRGYGIHLVFVVILIIVSVLANVQGTLFTKTLIDSYITPMVKSGSRDFSPLLQAILRVAVFYGIGVLATYIQSRLMIYVSQGTMRNLRIEMFDHMETLPIRYFDMNSRGDVMSLYTNDIDTLRQMISMSLPQFFNAVITIASVIISMFSLSLPLTLLTLAMSGVMLFVSGRLAKVSGIQEAIFG